MGKVERYFKNQLVWLDIAVNTIFGGSPYETISERCWRHQWQPAIWVLDKIFGEGHCAASEEGDETQYEVIK